MPRPNNDRLSKLKWLKRTHGHEFTPAEFRVLFSIFDHSGSDGRKSHPGLELMAEETGYRRTGVSEAVRGLKARGWIHETFRGSGKSGRASVFDLIPDAPNPDYRCPEEDATHCRDCSNGSALSGTFNPLQWFRSSGTSSVQWFRSCYPVSWGNRLNGSALPEPIRSLDQIL